MSEGISQKKFLHQIEKKFEKKIFEKFFLKKIYKARS